MDGSVAVRATHGNVLRSKGSDAAGPFIFTKRQGEMTGHELLAELTKLSSTQLKLEVQTEGCDCYGDVAKVTVEGRGEEYGDPTTIFLRRGPQTP